MLRNRDSDYNKKLALDEQVAKAPTSRIDKGLALGERGVVVAERGIVVAEDLKVRIDGHELGRRLFLISN